VTGAVIPRPLVFNDRYLGWLHEPPQGQGNGRGVVLCSAIGLEGQRTYRSWRILADALAGEGFTVLRFDYEGSGDSLDTHEDQPAVAGWLRSVTDAVEVMRSQPGIGRVAVVGLRLGALLAARALAGLDVIEDLVLLAPGTSGRHYARELRLLAEAWGTALLPPGSAPAVPSRTLNVAGDLWSPEMLADLDAIDLRRLEGRPATRILILEPEGRGTAPAVVAALSAAGAEVVTGSFPGFEAFTRDSILPQPPMEAFEQVARWLLDASPASSSRAHGDDLDSSVAAGTAPSSPGFLILPEGRESPALFGPANGLFGIIAEPADPSPQAPAVLLLNTGVTPRSGNGRLGTLLCRQLCRAGVTSLRMDLAGLGDSGDLPGRRASPLYDSAAEADVQAALDWLDERGHRRVVLVGICSGAYLAFHAARTDARIVGLISVNLQQFIWEEGMLVDFVDRNTRHPVKVYLRKTLKPRHLLRLLRGQTGAITTLRAVVHRVLQRQQRWILEMAEDVFGLRTEAGQVRRWIRDLSRQGVAVALWYGVEDSGLPALAVHCGPNGTNLSGLRGVEVAILEGVDHTLSFDPGRQHFMERVLRFVLSMPAPDVRAVS